VAILFFLFIQKFYFAEKVECEDKGDDACRKTNKGTYLETDGGEDE
jgi:hypothetical protein